VEIPIQSFQNHFQASFFFEPSVYTLQSYIAVSFDPRTGLVVRTRTKHLESGANSTGKRVATINLDNRSPLNSRCAENAIPSALPL
jgi:hypothetical protein